MYTYQDFIRDRDTDGILQAINNAVTHHLNSDIYKTALRADNYDHQKNETITNYVKTIFSTLGTPVEDFTASNNKLCSNFFHRLNTQRCTYLLGNGVSFTDHKEEKADEEGTKVIVDTTKERLGNRFDVDIKKIGYHALIHGICFGFWNLDRLHCFMVTEFVPLWDEETGALRAGIRFWRIDKSKPMIAVLYEEDGYTKYKSKGVVGLDFEEIEPIRAYKNLVEITEADGEEVVGEENYGSLPIVPMWGSNLKQSTLIGMQEKIDSFDLIRSGFANDLTDCAQVYWILENCGGMSDQELERFRDRLKIMHVAVADTENSGLRPFTQDIPHTARSVYLSEIRAGIYEDFGALDVHTVAAGATNDHIDAAYQPMDEEADDFEYQVTEFIQQLLKLIGIEDVPVFKRNRISNENEQTQMILSASEYLDDETILNKLPFVTVDEVATILANRDQEAEERLAMNEALLLASSGTNDIEGQEDQ